jgi:hypothetical protein
LLFPHLTSVSEVHRLATIVEERLPAKLGVPTEVITHLDSLEDHADVHREQHYTGKPTMPPDLWSAFSLPHADRPLATIVWQSEDFTSM